MSLGILGKKVGMTRVFDAEAGCMIPVTVVDVNGNEFLQVKTSEKDGYSAIQVAYDDQKEKRSSLVFQTARVFMARRLKSIRPMPSMP